MGNRIYKDVSMTLEDIRKKFATGRFLRRFIGEKTYKAVQHVTEHIFIKLEEHDMRLNKLERVINDLEKEKYNKFRKKD